MHVLITAKSPAHTQGCEGVLPAGTVLVALDQQPGATAFGAYPEDYDHLEQQLVPSDVRSDPSYFAYKLVFRLSDIGELLESLAPLDPRPAENRLPRQSPRAS